MINALTAYIGAKVFDGHTWHNRSALIIEDARVSRIVPDTGLPDTCEIVRLNGGIITAGFVDLQVNGGGGVMLNNTPTVDAIRTICDAHLQFGTTSLLPTLITADQPKTNAAIAAVKAAITGDVAGVLGIHLEGPHLSVARKGAHDPALIRRMETGDCEQLIELAQTLPSLFITVAPEATTHAQITSLSNAGAVVSLGHSDADYETVQGAAQAGASGVTHLFNAMSPLTNRAPGMVGAALDLGALSAGLIADGIHVDPAAIRIAVRSKNEPGRLFLVTDAMATVGSDLDQFTLDGRTIFRRGNRLTLSNGTLAGADLDMISAVRFMVNEIHVDIGEALRMASLYPAQILKRDTEIGSLSSGARADFIHLGDDLQVRGVWRGNQMSNALPT